MYINKKLDDVELIKNILDGDEKSLEALILKYDPFIFYIVSKKCGYFNEDFIQEGRLVLYKAIYDFDDKKEFSFFSFFKLCLDRKLNKLISNEKNYKKFVNEMILEKVHLAESKNNFLTRDKLYFPPLVFDNKIEFIIYEDCIINGLSLTTVSKKLNISYQKAYYYYKKVLQKIFNDLGKYIYTF